MVNYAYLNFQFTAERYTTMQSAPAFGASDDASFSNALNTAGKSENETDEKRNAPAKWSEYSLFTMTATGYIADAGTIAEFKRVMSELGIDMNTRPEPSHAITSEQEQWLSSRYDLGSLPNVSVTSEESSNFMLDLVYLNVFTFEEVIMSQSTVISLAPGEKGRLTFNGDELSISADNFLDAMEESADTLADFLMEYISQKFGKVENADEDVKNWYESTEKIVAQKRQVHNVLAEFFARLADDGERENSLGDGAKLDIENAADKLKEDFGRFI